MTRAEQLRKTAEEAERLAREAAAPAERDALMRFARDWRELESRAAAEEQRRRRGSALH